MFQPRENKHQTKILFFVSTWNVGYIWLQRGIRTRTIYIWVWHHLYLGPRFWVWHQDLRDKLVKIHIVKHTQWKGLIKHGYVYVESVYLQSMILFEQNLKWNKSCDVETCMIHTLTRPRAIYQIGLVLVRYPQDVNIVQNCRNCQKKSKHQKGHSVHQWRFWLTMVLSSLPFVDV